MNSCALDNNITHYQDVITELNRNHTSNHIVYIICLSTLSFIGLFGNGFVILVYGFKQNRTTHSTAILGLAISDFLVCSVAIPIEVAEKLNHFSLFTSITCKLWLTFCYFVVILSALIILILSVDRYKRVCTPMDSQYTPRYAIVLMNGACLIAIVLSCPHYFIWNTHLFKVDNYHITVEVCVTQTYEHNSFPTIYSCVILFILVTLVTMLVTIYSLIWKKIIKQSKYRKRFRSIIAVIDITAPIEKDQSSGRKITKISFTIVIVFIVSYLPSTIMKLLDTTAHWNIDDPETYNACVHQILARSSYCWNHIANPAIYALFDSKFRENGKDLIKRIFCFKKPN